MIRVAACGDIHAGTEPPDRLGEWFGRVGGEADLLVIAGDLTKCGTTEEAANLARRLTEVTVPVIGVLGNHDYHSDQQEDVADTIVAAGVHLLHGDVVVLEVGGERVGVAGIKGFGGGFPGSAGAEFGEPEMKAFMRHGREAAERLEDALDELDREEVGVRVSLTHYAPTHETLVGESPEIYPFLGSGHLGRAIDSAGADVAFHGHAHNGTERGLTPGGIPVRNVAQPVLKAPYRVYTVHGGRHPARHLERQLERR
jgi:Icc-related predicted phosphoesterase